MSARNAMTGFPSPMVATSPVFAIGYLNIITWTINHMCKARRRLTLASQKRLQGFGATHPAQTAHLYGIRCWSRLILTWADVCISWKPSSGIWCKWWRTVVIHPVRFRMSSLRLIASTKGPIKASEATIRNIMLIWVVLEVALRSPTPKTLSSTRRTQYSRQVLQGSEQKRFQRSQGNCYRR